MPPIRSKKLIPQKDRWVKWLQELTNQARGHGRIAYTRAHNSLSKYQGPLNEIDDLSKVPNIGASILMKLKQRQERQNNILEQQPLPELNIYIPEYQTGAYALLLALHQYPAGLYREELEIQSKIYSETVTLSCEEILISKGYVEEKGDINKYQITKAGEEIAQFLKLENEVFQSQQAKKDNIVPVIPPFNSVIFSPGKFNIVLVLDLREVATKKDRDYIINELKKKDIRVISRQLCLGDVLWIAQRDDAMELVLKPIIERKTIDDLGHSITDGRYQEQKHRLIHSGQQVIYLVENIPPTAVQPFNTQAIETSIINVQVRDGFLMKRTRSIDDTIRYLVDFHEVLKNDIEKQTLYGYPDNIVNYSNHLYLKQQYPDHLNQYQTFCKLNDKTANMTLQNLFINMLTNIPGISTIKATAVASVYGTPQNLYNAYKSLQNEKLQMLMVYNATKRNRENSIGKSASIVIYRMWYLDIY